MYQLNEQWVEKADDGKMHMYKAVEGGNCKGCTFGMMHKGSGLNDIHVCDREDDCPLEYADTIIKDLGIVDERGYLPEERTGMYPDIIYLGGNEFLESSWVAQVDDEVDDIHVTVYGDTEEEVKFKWNKRS